ncbi:hypothetical protein ACIBSV_46915 [Embleya sp. NPDC050154]|uniref:hypothetical protein n=1 Tax=Embleya sp. NPDC050154 TaxID=3363988 RepID=UPI003798B9A8
MPDPATPPTNPRRHPIAASLFDQLREYRAKIASGALTPAEAAGLLASQHRITEVGAAEMLAKPVAEIEADYRRIRERAEAGIAAALKAIRDRDGT